MTLSLRLIYLLTYLLVSRVVVFCMCFGAALLCWRAIFPVAGMCPVGLTLNLQVPLR